MTSVHSQLLFSNHIIFLWIGAVHVYLVHRTDAKHIYTVVVTRLCIEQRQQFSSGGICATRVQSTILSSFTALQLH